MNYTIILIIFFALSSSTLTLVLDQDITTNTILKLTDSPILIKKSIKVAKHITLQIEPGVKVLLNPKVRVLIEGKLIANGQPDKRIIFTKFNDTDTPLESTNLRLVEGEEYRQGKLHIRYNNQWRPVCSQNREWSQNDIKVACIEMGFEYGNFSLNSLAENYTSHILLPNPNCNGTETKLNDCIGFKSLSLGSSVCNLQELVGLHCWSANKNIFQENWWGLNFYNSTINERIISPQLVNTRLNTSASVMNYVDIRYGGVNSTNHRVAALSASPYPPILSNIRLVYNAYDALNFTDIRGPVFITDSQFSYNQGHAMNITSKVGYVALRNVRSYNNSGAGGYIKMTSEHWTEETPELVDLSKRICGQSVIPNSPIFPLWVLIEHPVPTYQSEDTCILPINTDKPNQVISVKLIEAMRDPTASAKITIVDVSTNRILAQWIFTSTPQQIKFHKLKSGDKLVYGPLYQGVSSTSQLIKVQFHWSKDSQQEICPYLRQCFRAVLQVSVAQSTNPEVLVENSQFYDNIQQGLRIENLGLYSQILHSQFHGNQFGAGLQMVNGSFDVLVHKCQFINNDRTGLNISSAGGYRTINESIFHGNQGHGLDIWNPYWTMSRDNAGQLINNIVHLSNFTDNLWNGIRFYNSSSPMHILVNYSRIANNRKYGIEAFSTLVNQNLLLTNFSVGFSLFQSNRWHSISLSPIGQMTGHVVNTTFLGHSTSGCIAIDNGLDFQEQRLLYNHLSVKYIIKYNTFINNAGYSPFVILARLTQSSPVQSCDIQYNQFLDNQINSIGRLPDSQLNTRMSTPAVIAIGSSNVVVTRNHIKNPQSQYEIAVQLEANDVQINASINFWGIPLDNNWANQHRDIYRRIFDRHSRYSLASLEYWPILKEVNLHSQVLSSTDAKYRPKFRDGNNMEIGGIIDLDIEQKVHLQASSSIYRVTRDIYVPFGAQLTIAAGTALEFDNSVGVFVQGSIIALGNQNNPIKMRSKTNSDSYWFKSMTEHVHLLTIQQMNQSNFNISQLISSNTTRIPSNHSFIEGVVRVNIKGQWMEISDSGQVFDFIAARIICTQLDLIVHPLDWKVGLSTSEISNSHSPSQQISNLRCLPWHTSIDQCEFDLPGQHRQGNVINQSARPISLRCYRNDAWAGIKIALTNEKSQLQYLQIFRAGLADYFHGKLTAGLHIDYNSPHLLDNLIIDSGISHGLLIHHNNPINDQFIPATASFITRIQSVISTSNLGHGMVLRSPWIHLDKCKFVGNRMIGLNYDPVLSEEELFQLRAGMVATMNLLGASDSTSVNRLGIHPSGIEVIYTKVGVTAVQRSFWSELSTTDPNNQHTLLISILDFNPNIHVESVTFYDDSYEKIARNPQFPSGITYRIPQDLTRFPIISNGKSVTIQIKVNGIISGRLALLVQSRAFRDLWPIPNTYRTANGLLFYPPTHFIMTGTDFTHNEQQGLSITHYNTGSDSQNRSYTMRQSRLYITIDKCGFLHNQNYAIKIPSVSPYRYDFYFPSYADDYNEIESNSRLSKIFYNVTNNIFQNNSGIILSEHNHVPYSNNIWRYFIQNNTFKQNIIGRVSIQIPFVSKKFDWRYISAVDHEIDWFDNQFIDNSNFHFDVTGYYLKLNIKSNKFTNNLCNRQGLIMFSGMEKLFDISDNEISQNKNCDFIFESNSFSQTETSQPVIGKLSNNVIIENSCNQINTKNNLINCYTIGVFGNQNVTVNFNNLNNSKSFNYELVAGLISNDFNNVFDARFNYWGCNKVEQIRKLIFDANSWNNFAEVNFSKYFMTNNLKDQTNIYNGEIQLVLFDHTKLNKLGGRIYKNLFLSYRNEPYIVEYDITVMPGIELIIEPGVEMMFKPNIGILVLGKLIAKGTIYRHIVMKPYINSNSSLVRNKRQVVNQKQMRFIGGNNTGEYEGFLQIYNETSTRWDYICDDQFSLDVAKVACRQMGFPSNNVVVKRSYLIDHQLYGYENPFVVKYVWTTRYICRGSEDKLSDCVTRLNYDFLQCGIRRDFVFMRCSRDFLGPNENYWGNIRIVNSQVELGKQLDEQSSDQSVLEYVDIIKAGMLHGELVSAIQSTHSTPVINFVSVKQSAWNGIDVVMPRYHALHLSNCSFLNNSGYGLALTLLNTDAGTIDPSTTTKQTQYPLYNSPLPSSILGLLEMCDINKEITLTDRLLVYYRYSYRTTACTKLIKSLVPNKRIAVRFLQLNMYYDPFTKNTIELYNGHAFNVTEILGRVDAKPPAKTGNRLNREFTNGFLVEDNLPSFVTNVGYDRLGIQMHVSPAGFEHGFIVELMTLPISPHGYNPNRDKLSQHEITESYFLGNQRGGIHVSIVGESPLPLLLYYNRLLGNGANPPMLNMTGAPSILMRMQNCRDASISNNLLESNRGPAIETHLFTTSLAHSIRLNITNNAVVTNSHGHTLLFTGNYLSQIQVLRNFISNNYAENLDTISIHGVVAAPFSHNYVANNHGRTTLNISGANDLSISSLYTYNGFFHNKATNYTRPSTVYADNCKNKFQYNYFRNLNNNYELTVGNKSIMKESPIMIGGNCPEPNDCRHGWTVMLERDSCVCYRPDLLSAQYNWWGEPTQFYITSKIYDAATDKYMVKVDSSNFLTSNKTVLDGSLYCPPSWKYVNNHCYFFVGAPMSYNEAKLFCHNVAGAVLANVQYSDLNWISQLVGSWQNNYNWINRYTYSTRVWVHSHVPFTSKCPAVKHRWLEGFPCQSNLPFICQKSPYGSYNSIQLDILIAIIMLVLVLIMIILLLLWFWRRNSINRHKAFLLTCDQLNYINNNNNQFHKTMSTIKTTSNLGDVAAGLSKYHEDVMFMRKNTLTDTPQTIFRPNKSSIESASSSMIGRSGDQSQRLIEYPTPMKTASAKKHLYKSSLASPPPASSTHDSYYPSGIGGMLPSNIRLSQPDVPTLSDQQIYYNTRPSHTGSQVILDSLYDSQLNARNQPFFIPPKNEHLMRSVSQRDSSDDGSDHYNPRYDPYIATQTPVDKPKTKKHHKKKNRHHQNLGKLHQKEEDQQNQPLCTPDYHSGVITNTGSSGTEI